MTTLAFAVAGAVIGGSMGGPAGAKWGWVIGSTIGAAFEYSQLPDSQGPRLEDLQIQQNSYGADIAHIWGCMRVAGTMVWKTDLIEHEQSESAKGGMSGPESSTFAYTFSGAFLVCEGPIAGVTRVWANKRLIYDYRAYGSRFVDAESISGIRLYLGTETQAADPLILATEGNAPAMRGYAYVVFEDFKLSQHYGNRPPQFEFEVIVNGTRMGAVAKRINADHVANDDSMVYVPACDELWVVDVARQGIARLDPDDGTELGTIDLSSYTDSGGTGSKLDRALSVYDWVNHRVWFMTNVDSYATPLKGKQLICINAETGVVDHAIAIGMDWYGFNVNPYTAGTLVVRSLAGGLYVIDPATGGVLAGYTTYLVPDGHEFIFDNAGRVWFACGSPSALVSLQIEATGEAVGTYHAYPIVMAYPPTFLAFDPDRNSLWASGGPQASAPGQTIEFELDTFTQVTASTIPHGGNHGVGPAWDRHGRVVYDASSHMIWFAESQDGGSDFVYAYKTDNVAAPAFAVNMNKIASGLIWDPSRNTAFQGANTTSASGAPADSVGSGTHRIDAGGVAFEAVPLDVLAKDICLMAEIPAAAIDTTSLAGDYVLGYSRARQMSTRDLLDPLRSAYNFDAVESNDVLKFVKRGGAPAVIFPEAERAAHEAGSEIPPSLRITRLADLELPWEVEVQFPDINNDHQLGTAYARRLSHFATTASKFQMPVTMTQATADGIAQTILLNAWARRVQLDWTSTRKYDKYEPTDRVVVPTMAEAYVARITSKRNLNNGIIEWSGMEEDQLYFPPPAACVELDSVLALGRQSGQIFDEDAGELVDYDWANTYQRRVYVPERDEWWINRDTWPSEIETWEVGKEIECYSASGGLVEHVAIPPFSGQTDEDLNVPRIMRYSPYHGCVWGLNYCNAFQVSSRRFWKIDAATLAVTAYAHGLGDVDNFWVNPFNGEIWYRLYGGGSPVNQLKKYIPGVGNTMTITFSGIVMGLYQLSFVTATTGLIIDGDSKHVYEVNLAAGTYVLRDLTSVLPPMIPTGLQGPLGIYAYCYDSNRNSIWCAIHNNVDGTDSVNGPWSIREISCATWTIVQAVAIAPLSYGGDFDRMTFDAVNNLVWFTRIVSTADEAYSYPAGTDYVYSVPVAICTESGEFLVFPDRDDDDALIFQNAIAIDVGYTPANETRILTLSQGSRNTSGRNSPPTYTWEIYELERINIARHTT